MAALRVPIARRRSGVYISRHRYPETAMPDDTAPTAIQCAPGAQHADVVDLFKALIFEAQRANAGISAILDIISRSDPAPKS